MTLEQKIQLVDDLGKHLRSLLDQDEDQNLEMILSVATDYVKELQRKQLAKKAKKVVYFEVRLASALAGVLLRDLLDEKSEQMAGWSHGCPPANMLQAIANMLSEAVLEFQDSLAEMQQCLPGLSVEAEAALSLLYS